jgi:hypothetical protein
LKDKKRRAQKAKADMGEYEQPNDQRILANTIAGLWHQLYVFAYGEHRGPGHETPDEEVDNPDQYGYTENISGQSEEITNDVSFEKSKVAYHAFQDVDQVHEPVENESPGYTIVKQ